MSQFERRLAAIAIVHDRPFRRKAAVLLMLAVTAAFADVEVNCVSDEWPDHLEEMISIDDLEPSGSSAQIILQLPIRTSDLELEGVQLRRFDYDTRTLWIGLSFKELNENRSWTSIEIRRSDLEKYRIVAYYRNLDPERNGCAGYEWTVDHTELLRENN